MQSIAYGCQGVTADGYTHMDNTPVHSIYGLPTASGQAMQKGTKHSKHIYNEIMMVILLESEV